EKELMVSVAQLMVEQLVLWYSEVDFRQELPLVQLVCHDVPPEVLWQNRYAVLDKKS
ncbi:hypothetical protein Tco_1321787, partial [Tanacetum coccineum]